MADSSWDNAGLPPPKQGLGTGMKVLLGCGIALVVLIATCTVGGALLRNAIRKDPQAFEKRIEGFAQGLVQKDWVRFRDLVVQLQTDDGARTLYRSNPGLHQAHPTEEQFLVEVRGWRPRLKALPAEAPVGKHRRRHRGEDEPTPEELAKADAERQPSVSINKVFGTTRIRCRYPGGPVVAVTFDGERIERLTVE
jgi:hypothetical protein